MGAIASAGLAGAWASGIPHTFNPQDILLAGYLAAAVIAAYQFPIHIRYGHKVEMTTTPLYLMVVLVPSVPLAATAAGLAVLGAELMVRARRGNYYSDSVTAAARWAVVGLAGSVVARLPAPDQALRLLLVALVLWVGETLTAPLVLAPMTGETTAHTLISVLRRATPTEWAQYVLGLIGALAATIHGAALLFMVVPIVLVYVAFKNVMELRTSTRHILEGMADAVDLRDPYTGGHSRRVAELTTLLLREMYVWGPEVEVIIAAARVHDIGKIGIPDYILNKPAYLSPEEHAIMCTHAERGAELLRRYRDFAGGADIVRHHHERWDGQGYPARLKGTSIPFGARVIAVTDSFDAMTSDRPYRQAMTPEQALHTLLQGRGTQWDPAVVDAFVAMMKRKLEDQRAEPIQPSQSPALFTITP
jgi:putative nucleotidyltransferase with HDIG domain